MTTHLKSRGFSWENALLQVQWLRDRAVIASSGYQFAASRVRHSRSPPRTLRSGSDQWHNNSRSHLGRGEPKFYVKESLWNGKALIKTSYGNIIRNRRKTPVTGDTSNGLGFSFFDSSHYKWLPNERTTH